MGDATNFAGNIKNSIEGQWTKFETITSSLTELPFINYPEPFVYNGKSYISILLTKKAPSGKIVFDGSEQVWLVDIDPQENFYRKVSNDGNLHRDPEPFVAETGAFIYYSEKTPEGNFIVHKTDTGLGSRQELVIDGDTLAVSASQNDNEVPDSGSAYIYSLSSLLSNPDNSSRETANPDSLTGIKPKDTLTGGASNDNLFAGVDDAQFSPPTFSDLSIEGDEISDFELAADGLFSKQFFTGFGDSGNTSIEDNSLVKITASDGQAYDSFGQNVSLYGNTLLVGAARDDDNGLDSGSAYIFNNINGVWTERAKLKPKDGRAGDLFGDTIRLNGSRAFVGSWKRGSGAVYIFRESGGLWTQTVKLRPSDGKQGDRFGSSFDSTDSGTILIGASSSDQKGLDSGCVYVYNVVNGIWTETGKIYASDPSPGALFGRYIDIDGNQAVIGAVKSNASQPNSGSVYIYENLNGIWTETAKLSASDGKNGDEFGTPAAIEGNTIVVGASESGGTKGAAYVFEKVNGKWQETAKLTANDGQVGEEFGTSVTISNNTIAVSPRHDDDRGVDSGSVYIFRKINGVWTQVYKLTAIDGKAGDVFGKRVVIDGDTLAVSAFQDDNEVPPVPDSGSVYLYSISSLLSNPDSLT
ncbi:FG-GAP repeat protein, partial [Microcystis aeruginosa]